LFPAANITLGDIRTYKLEVRFDYADDFSDKAMLREMERRFSFLGQIGLPNNAFSCLGTSLLDEAADHRYQHLEQRLRVCPATGTALQQLYQYDYMVQGCLSGAVGLHPRGGVRLQHCDEGI